MDNLKKEDIKKYGINSMTAHTYLIERSGSIEDETADYVRFDFAMNAIKLAEDEAKAEYIAELKRVKQEASWFMQIINKLFCMHDWEKMEGRTISSGSGDNKRITKEIIIYNCKKCGKIKQQKIGVDD